MQAVLRGTEQVCCARYGSVEKNAKNAPRSCLLQKTHTELPASPPLHKSAPWSQKRIVARRRFELLKRCQASLLDSRAAIGRTPPAKGRISPSNWWSLPTRCERRRRLTIPRSSTTVSTTTFDQESDGTERDGTGATNPKNSGQLPPLLTRPVHEAVWTVAWPSIFIGCLNSVQGIAGAYWIGRLGTAELKAMGGVAFAAWMIDVMCDLPASGTHSLASQAEGAGDHAKVEQIIVQGMWASLPVILALAASAMLANVYFDVLGMQVGSAERAAGSTFLVTSLLVTAPQVVSRVLLAGFKGLGRMGPALVITSASTVLTLLLDPLLMFGWGPVPALGVAGAAVSVGISAVIISVFSLFGLAKVGVRLRWHRPAVAIIKRLLEIGSPMAIGGFWFCLVYIFIGRIVSNEGAHNLAAMGLGHRVETMAFTVAQGFSVGAATLVGQWVGAQRHHQAAKAAAMSATLCGISLAIFGGVVFMGAEPLLKIFTQDAAIIKAAMGYLQINAVVFAFMGIEAVYEGAFTGLGNTYPTLMVGIIINGVRVPVALALAQGMGMGINGVWLTIAISTVAKSLAKWYLFHQQIDKLDSSHKANMLDDSTKANTLNDSDIAKTLDDSNQANVLDDSRKANMLDDSTKVYIIDGSAKAITEPLDGMDVSTEP